MSLLLFLYVPFYCGESNVCFSGLVLIIWWYADVVLASPEYKCKSTNKTENGLDWRWTHNMWLHSAPANSSTNKASALSTGPQRCYLFSCALGGLESPQPKVYSERLIKDNFIRRFALNSWVMPGPRVMRYLVCFVLVCAQRKELLSYWVSILICGCDWWRRQNCDQSLQ